jgi:diguanylate cyclase (GGDEF)-like protein
MPEYQLKSRILSLYYVMSATALAALCYGYYLQGFYPLTLTGSIGIPLFLFAAIYHFIQRDNPTHYYVDLILLCCITSLILYNIEDYSHFILHWAYSLPLISFFILPIMLAIFSNILFLSLIFMFLYGTQDLNILIRTLINFGLLTGSAWSYAYLAELKNKSLKQLAITDHITGTYNKRHLLHLLKQEISRCKVTENKLGLIALEIDEIQQTIDIHGRGPTHQFLKDFIAEISKLTRNEDEIFREKGGLFFILLPNCSKDGGIVLKERLEHRIKQSTWVPINEISVSTSITTYDNSMNEQAMYNDAVNKLRRNQQNRLRILATA